MPDLHKTLILANLVFRDNGWQVDETIAMTTEHAPFRAKKKIVSEVGAQVKRQKTEAVSTSDEANVTTRQEDPSAQKNE